MERVWYCPHCGYVVNEADYLAALEPDCLLCGEVKWSEFQWKARAHKEDEERGGAVGSSPVS